MVTRIIRSAATRTIIYAAGAIFTGYEVCESSSFCEASSSSPYSAVLPSRGDPYGGVIIGTVDETNSEAFRSRLQSSLDEWKRDGKRGVWLKLPIDKAAFIPVAVKEGFGFHHAEPGYLMLTNWLPEGEKNPLPPNASHQVGL